MDRVHPHPEARVGPRKALRVELGTQRQWELAAQLDRLRRANRVQRWWPIQTGSGIHWYVEVAGEPSTLTIGKAEQLVRGMLGVECEQLVLL
jgi:hypothetical protein